MGSYWAGTHGPFHLCPSTWPSVLAPRAPGAALLHFPGGKQKCISQNALRSQTLLKKKFSRVTHMQSSLLSFLSSECELRTSKCSCALRLVALSWPFAVPLQNEEGLKRWAARELQTVTHSPLRFISLFWNTENIHLLLWLCNLKKCCLS